MTLMPAIIAVDVTVAAETLNLTVFVADAAPTVDVLVRVLWKTTFSLGAVELCYVCLVCCFHVDGGCSAWC